MVRKRPQPLEEWFCVRCRSPPPVTVAKSRSLHSDQPRQAPSLAGFFTSVCGLGTHPRGPFSGVFSPVSSLFLCPLRTCRAPSPQGKTHKNQLVRQHARPRNFFQHRSAYQNRRKREPTQVSAIARVLLALAFATTSSIRRRCASQHCGASVARSNNATSSGNVPFRITAWMSGGNVVRLIMQLM